MKRTRIVLALLAALFAACAGLQGCGGGGTDGGASSGRTAYLTVSLPGTERAQRAAASVGPIPAEVTEILIAASSGETGEILAGGDILAAGGELTLEVPSGRACTLSGQALAGPELLYQGSEPIAPLLPGETRAATLRLWEAVSVSLSPPAPLPAAGGEPVAVTYRVEGLQNDAVVWYVNGIEGGDATVGTVDAYGVYTPPASIPPTGPIVRIRCVPVAAPSFAQEVQVTLLAPGGDQVPPTVAASLPGGTYAPFTLTFAALDDQDSNPQIYYTNDQGPPSLEWFRYQGGILLVAGTQTFRFFAADAAGNWSAVQSETYIIEVPVVAVAISPRAPRVVAGETVALSAAVTGGATTAVTWLVNGIAGGNASLGTVDAAGRYTAPAALPAGGVVNVGAVSADAPSAADQVSLTVVHPAAAGLTARYSTGPLLLETAVVHGWSSACGATGNNEYQGQCVPAAASPVDWAWGTGFDADWSGWVHAPVSGEYRFASNGWVDGIVYVAVNGVVLANLNTVGAGYSGVVNLNAGDRVPVTLRFAPNGGSNNMRFFWAPPAAATEVVPRAYLEPTVAVAVSPATATVEAGGSRPFAASVVGSPNTAVTWGVEAGTCGAAAGSISSGGLYTAGNPAADCQVTLRASSVAAPGTSGTAAVTVQAAPPPVVTVTVSPPSATVPAGGQQAFTATVTGTANTAVTWGVEAGTCGAAAGSISSGGLYTAGNPTADCQVTVRATGVADPSATGSAAVTIRSTAEVPTVTVVISPRAPRVVAGETIALAATVTGATTGAATWTVNGIPGGNAGVGTIDAAGRYSSPTVLPAAGTVAVGAASVDAPAVADQVTLTVVHPAAAGLTARYSTGPVLLETVVVHGWSSACGATGNNEYQGQCVPAASSPVDWAWGTGFDADWSGWVHAPVSGEYRFASNGWVDGIVYVAVNGVVLANLNTVGAGYSDVVSLNAGDRVPVTLRFAPNGGSNNMRFFWAPPAAATEVVPRAYLEPTVAVAVSPATATLEAGGSRPFAASVVGSPNTAVTWGVEAGTCGAAAGSISSGGLYTAGDPAADCQVTVRATSVAHPSATGSAAVAIRAAAPAGGGWSRTYPGLTAGRGIEPTADGGYVVVSTGPFEGRGWVLRMGPTGNSVWQKAYGGAENLFLLGARETARGELVLFGGVNAFDGPFDMTASSELWVGRLAPDGALLWETAFGTVSVEYAADLRLASDGGYLFLGNTWVADNSDFVVVKLGADGDLLWQKRLGGASDEYPSALAATPDGGCLAVGSTYSFGTGDQRIWAVKLGADGEVHWQKAYGLGRQWESASATSVLERESGGFLIGGQIVGEEYPTDWLLLEVDAAGALEWARAYGSPGNQLSPQVVAAGDGFVLGGYTNENDGNFDAGLLGLDASGAIRWQKTYGGGDSDYLISLAGTPDGGTVAGGYVSARFPTRTWLWVWKVEADGSMPEGCALARDASFVSSAATLTVNDTTAVAEHAGFATREVRSSVRPTSVEPLTQCIDAPEVTVYPRELRMAVDAVFPFRAVDVGTGEEGVTWYADGVAGGYPGGGFIDAQGTYEAPLAVPMPPEVVIEAVSIAEPGAVGRATVELVPSTPRWVRALGGSQNDELLAIRQTADGGYIAAGYTTSFGAGGEDAWVVKLDPDGGVEWQKAFGGTFWERAQAVAESASGGYLVAGYTRSFGAGLEDWWLLRLTADGDLLWAKTYGGTTDERAFSAVATPGGHWVVAGYRMTATADRDGWLLKLDDDGAVLHQQVLGGAGTDELRAVEPTSDGGYVAVGTKLMFFADPSISSNADVWVIKLGADLEVLWQTTLGTPAQQLTPQHGYAIQQTSDGGYILAGDAYFGSERYTDFWVVRLNAAGGLVWENTYGRPWFGTAEVARGVRQTADGGFLVAGDLANSGWTMAFGGVWLLKLDALGDVEWQKVYGSPRADTLLHALDLTSDDGFVLAASDWHVGAGGRDAWLLRLDGEGNVDPDCGYVDTTPYVVGSTGYTAVVTGYTAAATDVVGVDSAPTVTATSARPTVQCVGAGP